MKLLEHEAKSLLRVCKIPTPDSIIITKNHTPELSLPMVIKSQVPIGGRGKLGGVVIAENENEVKGIVDTLFALDIRGFKPSCLLAESKLEIADEYYFSLIINRQAGTIELVAHPDGGIEVEDNNPGSFLRVTLDGSNFDIAGEQLAEFIDLPEQTFVLQDLIENSYKCFVKNDATLLEINPLILTKGSEIIAGDCKMELDDAATFRHPEWDFEAEKADANFVSLNHDGTVATVANGAGLAMATVDAVTNLGLKPANFLDIGGGATTEKVVESFKKIIEFKKVDSIVINIFGGIVRCDIVADAIIEARKQIDNLPDLYIRLSGNNSQLAGELLSAAGLKLYTSLDECLEELKK